MAWSPSSHTGRFPTAPGLALGLVLGLGPGPPCPGHLTGGSGLPGAPAHSPIETAAGQRPAGAPHFEQIDLFAAGELGVHTYRIPAIVTTSAGTVIAVCDARRDDSGDLPGNIDLVMRRSNDLGLTWEAIRVIRDEPEGYGCGDPSLLVDRDTGRLFCFYAHAPPGIGFRSSRGGSNAPDDPHTLHARTICSEDDGATWSEPVDLNPQIKRPEWQALFAASGHGIQTSTGRLIQPYVVRDEAGVVTARNAWSDDHGRTWRMGAAAGHDVNESKVIERRDGRVLQNMRHNTITARFTAISDDGGLTFGPMQRDPTLIDPRVNASITRGPSSSPGDDREIVLFSNPASLSTRERMTVRVSLDGARSWAAERLVHPGPAAYSSLTVLDGDTIGLLYERGEKSPYERITFARFDLEWALTVPEPRALLDAAGRPDPTHPDLWAWFDASRVRGDAGDEVIEIGETVNRWFDGTGNGHHLARSSDGPGHRRTGSPAGRSAVDFSGDADLWGAAAGSGEFGTLPNGCTLFVVARLETATPGAYLLDRSTGRGGFGLRVAPDGKHWQIHVGRSSEGPPIDLVLDSAPLEVGRFVIHVIRLEQDRILHDVDGRRTLAARFDDGGLPLHQGGLILSADFHTENDARCAVAEILAYRVPLDQAPRRAIERYLADRHGIELESAAPDRR